MIRSGVIRFLQRKTAFTDPGVAEVRQKCVAIAESLLEESKWTPELTVREDDEVSINLTELYGKEMFYRQRLSRVEMNQLTSSDSRKAFARRLYVQEAAGCVEDAMLDFRNSESADASLFSTYRQALLALRAIDEEAPALNRVAAWETTRSIELPWVSALTVAQVLNLRTEAATALPAFRESFVQQLMNPDAKAASIATAIQELRSSAADLQAEITGARVNLERIYRGVFGMLGMSFAIYGAATGQLAAAGSGLLSVLGALHGSGRADFKSQRSAQSKPAYVLVKAKELAMHVH